MINFIFFILYLFYILCIGNYFVNKFTQNKKNIDKKNKILLYISSLYIGFGLDSIISFFCLIVSLNIFIIKYITIFIGFIFIINILLSKKYTNILLLIKNNLLFIFIIISSILITTNISFSKIGGEWDAYSIWNLRARSIFRSQNNYIEQFNDSSNWWKHMDYPLFLPLTIYKSWIITGENYFNSAIISIIFTIGSLVVIYTSLISNYKEKKWLGLLLLFGTPFYITHGVSQYAEIELSCFLLLTIIFITFFRKSQNKNYLNLVGFFIGLSMWTKNEGIMFFAITYIMLIIYLFLVKKQKYIINLILGSFIPIFTLISFKIYLSSENDLFSNNSINKVIGNLLNFDRHLIVLKEFLKHSFSFGNWKTTLTPLLFLYFLSKKNKKYFELFIIILIFFLFYIIYIITPHEINWHIQTSMDRLIYQLWPTIIFILIN